MEATQTAPVQPKASLEDAVHGELNELHDAAALLSAAQDLMTNSGYGDPEAHSKGLRLVMMARAKVDGTVAVFDKLV
jgi:hypothetical protein